MKERLAETKRMSVPSRVSGPLALSLRTGCVSEIPNHPFLLSSRAPPQEACPDLPSFGVSSAPTVVHQSP